jgi:predicted ArsR family transcriptional regulator
VTSKHLRTLAEAGYVRLTKRGFSGRPRTWAALTGSGREAFAGHVAELRRLADLAAD